jgi:hypothetical protein
MKDCLHRASLVRVQACAKEARVVNAAARAIACSSTEARHPFEKHDHGSAQLTARGRSNGVQSAKLLAGMALSEDNSGCDRWSWTLGGIS